MDSLRARYLDWPHEVSLETFARCNAACTFCPYTTLDRIGEKMPDELIDAVIEELKQHPRPFFFAPFKVNEPFLDKRLIPICRKVNEEIPRARLRLFSNGSALTDRHMTEVAGLRNVEHLWISLNECDPEAYRRTMGLEFDRTAANLDRLHDMVEAGAFRHRVMVSRVCEEFGGASVNDEWFSQYVECRWPLFGCHLIKRDAWLGFLPGDVEIPDAPCGRWFELNIMATGKIALCCMDSSGQFQIGDIRNGVYASYNAPHWRERREKMLSRREVHPCSGCSY